MKTDRTCPIHIIAPQAERDAFRAAADRAGLNMSTWARQVLRAAAGMHTAASVAEPVPPRAARALVPQVADSAAAIRAMNEEMAVAVLPWRKP